MGNENNTKKGCTCIFTPASEIKTPSLDGWLAEAKAGEYADQCGMYLFHNGIVRRTAKKQVRQGEESAPVAGMNFSYDREKVEKAMESASTMPGIYYIRVWLNEGSLKVGDNIMLVLVGGDIRPHVIDALQTMVGKIKNSCVSEQEKY
ncbi:MAG: molybdenum cofactor biosynthesis protein MoaE [Anaerovoracaceae bacterium]|jgi:molybdopterin synthase catalytic subunit